MNEKDRQAAMGGEDFYDAPEEEQSGIQNVETVIKDVAQNVETVIKKPAGDLDASTGIQNVETGPADSVDIVKKETSEKARRLFETPEGRIALAIIKRLPRQLLFEDGRILVSLNEVKRKIQKLAWADNDNNLPFKVEKRLLRRLVFLIEMSEERINKSAQN